MAYEIVLSLVTGTTPGRVSLDREFVVRLTTLVAAPPFTLVAVQFPAVGTMVAAWIDPVLRTLK